MNSVEDWERIEVVDPFHFGFDTWSLFSWSRRNAGNGSMIQYSTVSRISPAIARRISKGELPIVRTLLNQGEAGRFAKS